MFISFTTFILLILATLLMLGLLIYLLITNPDNKD